MKIAVVCDWLVTLGGAEKVLTEILTCFPQADLFSVIDFLPSSQRGALLNKNVTTTFIQKFPFVQKKYRSYLPFMPLAIEQLDLTAYDLILSSSHAVAKGVLTRPGQVHISYTHSPMRYAWDLQHQYLRESGLDRSLRGYLARYFLHRLRLWVLQSAYRVDYFVANSQFIAKRIEKIYRRQAEVIYPPIDLAHFTPYLQKENFYLTASRLVPYKRVDLIVESFQAMPDQQLIVIGAGPEMKKIKNKASPNVKILGYQPNSVLIDYLQKAKAFIFAAEEDFGLLPLEAQACGTPVIAYGKGGALETVKGLDHPQPSGLFFAEQTLSSLQQAIRQFEASSHLFQPEACVAQAHLFRPELFRERLKEYVAQKYYTEHSR